MTSKKNGFWTFIFSLLPGAGEMYMGFFKQGVSLMGLFFLICFLATWMSMGPLLFLIPVIWFYSFFHVHNLRSLPEEEFYAVEDEYLFHLDSLFSNGTDLKGSQRKLLAVILILVGVLILWKNITSLLGRFLPYAVYWRIVDSVPQLVIAAALIAAGVWLIRGKKLKMDQEEKGEWQDEN